MEVILGKTAGFCYGVKRAVDGAKRELEDSEEVYCLGEIVHNENVIENLEKKGLKIIQNVEDAQKKMIIRAHGVEKKIYEKANKLNLKLVDLTCPKVLKIHKIAEEYASKGFFILLIGNKKHPEIIGIKSFCLENVFIIENQNDIVYAIEAIQKSEIKDILMISQTTYNSKKFDEIINLIKEKLNESEYKITVNKTICPATEMRQKETEEIAKEVDYMIIVGDKKSSNTNKLYEIASKYCENTVFIDNTKNLNVQEAKRANKVGIMAGASTPDEDIKIVFERVIF